MKATLNFDLDNKDDEMALDRCRKSLDMALVLWDFDQWLRGEYKYHDKGYCEEIRDKLTEIMNNHDVNLDNLIT